MTKQGIAHNCVYNSQIPMAAQSESLTQNLSADVCIIGGGISGLVAARYLLDKGATVALLESHHIGWGASGRNSGQLIPGFNRDVRDLADIFGEAPVLAAYQGTLESLAAIKEDIKHMPHHCHFKSGIVMAAPSVKALKNLERYRNYLHNKLNRDMLLSAAEETAALVGSQNYYGGLIDEDGGHFCSRSYLQNLTAECLEKGLMLFENSTVANLTRQGDHIQARTLTGSISCDKMIVATNAYGELLPTQRKHVLRLNAIMVATAPLPASLQSQVLPHDHAVFEWKHLLNYYRKTFDGRLVFGAADNASNLTEEQLSKAFKEARQRMLGVFPQLKDVPVTHGWYGRISVSHPEMIDVGQAYENVFYLQGDAGHGLLPFHMSATAIAKAISGHPQMFNLLQSMQADPIPGAGRFDDLYARLGSLYFRMVDAFN